MAQAVTVQYFIQSDEELELKLASKGLKGELTAHIFVLRQTKQPTGSRPAAAPHPQLTG